MPLCSMISMYNIKRLESVTDVQVEEITDLCVRAFSGDISQRALLGGDWSLQPDFFRALVRATALEGELYIVAVGQDEKIASTASWFRPGSRLFGTEEQRSLGYNEFFAKLSAQTQNWWKHTYPELIIKLDNQLFTREEAARRWWCSNLATHADHEGKGYATALVEIMYKKAKDTETLLSLATSPEINVHKYISMGFHERGGILVPAATGDFYAHILSREP